MSVVEAKRTQSQFEVIHHWYETRKEITTLMLYDFGLKPDRQERQLLKRLQIDDPSKLEGDSLERWNKHHQRMVALVNWFLTEERNAVLDCLRAVNEEISLANSIYPTVMAELTERRIHQDRAIGQCFRLKQELQYIIETLEVDINRYMRLARMIDRETELLKGWRKSDNRFRKKLK